MRLPFHLGLLECIRSLARPYMVAWLIAVSSRNDTACAKQGHKGMFVSCTLDDVSRAERPVRTDGQHFVKGTDIFCIPGCCTSCTHLFEKGNFKAWHLGCPRRVEARFVALAVMEQNPSGEANKREGVEEGDYARMDDFVRVDLGRWSSGNAG